jgi:hypothetical protein
MKFIKFFAGLLLLPLCAALSQTLWALVIAINPESAALIPAPAAAMLIGLGLWLLLYYTMPRPVRSYILAHELTHALWGAVMGADIFSINVSEDKGSVVMSKTNFLITLAPYFFPLYTVLTIAGYYGLGIFFDVEKYHLFWLAAIGLSWGFHLTFTISALMQHQTDIRENGHLFSYAVIYLCNVLGICIWIIMVSSATLETMINQMRDNTIVTATVIYETADKYIEKIPRNR